MANAWLEIQRETGIDRRSMHPQGNVGRAEGICPGCGRCPFMVRGGNIRRLDDRTLKSDGHCVECGDPVGYIYARPDTLFGLEEDAAVLEHGRGRVY